MQLPSCRPGVSGAAGCQVFTPRAHCSAARIAFSTLLVLFSHAQRAAASSCAPCSQQNKKTKKKRANAKKGNPLFGRAQFRCGHRESMRVFPRSTMPIILPKTKHRQNRFWQRAHTSRVCTMWEPRLFVLFRLQSVFVVFIFFSLETLFWNVNTTCANSKRIANVMIDFGKGALDTCFHLKAVTQFHRERTLSCQRVSCFVKLTWHPRKFKRVPRGHDERVADAKTKSIAVKFYGQTAWAINSSFLSKPKEFKQGSAFFTWFPFPCGIHFLLLYFYLMADSHRCSV